MNLRFPLDADKELRSDLFREEFERHLDQVLLTEIDAFDRQLVEEVVKPQAQAAGDLDSELDGGLLERTACAEALLALVHPAGRCGLSKPT